MRSIVSCHSKPRRLTRPCAEQNMLALFDGFDPVEESELPKEINTLHIADASTEQLKSRFKFSDRL